MTVRFVHGKSVYKIGVQLEKEKLGKKWICPTTGKKFYDLNKEPVISPYTGEQLEIVNTENVEKKEEIILETDNKETSQISETDEVNEVDSDVSDVDIIDDNEKESITENDENFSDDTQVSDSNIDELEEFDLDEEIDDDLDNDEFLENNDDSSVEDVIGSVKKNKEED